MTSRRVGRTSRMIDLASLVLVLAGALMYVRAYVGLDTLRARGLVEFERGKTEIFGSVNEFNRWRRFSNVGLGVAGFGVVVGLSAAAHFHRRRNEPHVQEHQDARQL